MTDLVFKRTVILLLRAILWRLRTGEEQRKELFALDEARRFLGEP